MFLYFYFMINISLIIDLFILNTLISNPVPIPWFGKEDKEVESLHWFRV